MEEQESVAKKNVASNKTGMFVSFLDEAKIEEAEKTDCPKAAAKAALRRKKVHEKNLEQTTAQIAQLEQQIYSIEAANINQETLNAMKAAGSAMTQIHGSMTIDKVDETMYVLFFTWYSKSASTDSEPQGPTPRTASTQRRNCPGHHQPTGGRTSGRGRAGRRTRRVGAGGYGRAYAQDGDGACGRSDQSVTCCCERRA